MTCKNQHFKRERERKKKGDFEKCGPAKKKKLGKKLGIICYQKKLIIINMQLDNCDNVYLNKNKSEKSTPLCFNHKTKKKNLPSAHRVSLK